MGPSNPFDESLGPLNPFDQSLIEDSKKSSTPEARKKLEARPEVERRQVKRCEPAEPVIDAKIITVNKVVRNEGSKRQLTFFRKKLN